MRLEELSPGGTVSGVIAGGDVTIVAVATAGPDAVVLTYRTDDRRLDERVLYRSDELALGSVATVARRPFDAPGADFRLAAEAQRIKLAGLFDPMLALATSAVDPLPHQIRAVYGELLPRTPLRFLLADDPGAGKTIMAGLYIKELLLRGDLARCLVVAPGALVEQWQDELFDKFELDFEILTPAMIEATAGAPVFERHPLLIARMDQLARNEDLLAELTASEWDLVVVDEAHRMAAHYFGNELTTTRRYELGRVLGRITRHFLLMTATPHAGKEEDYQLFLALIDPDRFEGKFRRGTHSTDTTGLMRRMIKEDLLTFEGRPLFPERVAETVPYELSPAEADLYAEVTHYVRTEMNRAERLAGRRGNTVGFALTVLQRRLASSPEAIWRSLQRRQQRLKRRRQEMLDAPTRPEVDDDLQRADRMLENLDDLDELDAEQIETLEEEVLDAATAARTVQELDAELRTLRHLEQRASAVRKSGQDRKWVELRTLVQERAMVADRYGAPRKLIVFTEHRDTLHYLSGRIRDLLGNDDAVVEVHGAVRRSERRRRTEEFSKNTQCRVLVATDAAGEGLNLQRAHLMVNYDLPWNPNRIEQRFGRIHRIGQREVCRLWNLVATGTREGDVFIRLLAKVEEQRRAYGGRVFDVLGEVFAERPLRELLVEAILKGEDPETRAKLDRVIDHDVAAGLQELLKEHALSRELLGEADLAALRRQMDEARARRLQPHYIELFFRTAFGRLGGRIVRREKGRYEIGSVPAALRQPGHRSGHRTPIASRYERIAFDPDHARTDDRITADVVAPVHPLFDAVVDATLTELRSLLARGAVLVDPAAESAAPARLLVAVAEEVVNGHGDAVAKRFGFVQVTPDGVAADAGTAPYLDFTPVPGSAIVDLSRYPWLADAEQAATRWIVEHELPAYSRGIRSRIRAEVDRTRAAVTSRLRAEVNRLYSEAAKVAEDEAAGRKVRVRPATLERRAEDLDARLAARLRNLALDAELTLKPPHVAGVALVVPLSAVTAGDAPAEPDGRARETREVERRAVDAVLAAEKALGREPEEMPVNNPGYDIRTTAPDGHVVFIEVKGRLSGAEDFFVTYNEVLLGKNAAAHYRLALVSVSPDGADRDEIRYLADPFARTQLGDFTATGITGKWSAEWARGTPPF